MKRIRPWLLALLAVILPLSYAAVPLPADLPSLAKKADTICLATCIELRGEWDSQRMKIWTTAVYKVESVLQGPASGEALVVRFLGGTVGRISQIAVGLPLPTVGSRDLLLLGAADASGKRMPIAAPMNRFPVTKDGAGFRVLTPLSLSMPGRESRQTPWLPLPVWRDALNRIARQKAAR